MHIKFTFPEEESETEESLTETLETDGIGNQTAEVNDIVNNNRK